MAAFRVSASELFKTVRGWVLAAVMTGVFIVVTGLTPGLWIAKEWQDNHQVLFGDAGRVAIIIVGMTLIGVALYFRPPALTPAPEGNTARDIVDLRLVQPPCRPEGSIPLNEAAEIAYKKVQKTALGNEIERVARRPSEIIRLTAQQFLSRGVVWGKRWPSSDYELLADQKRRGWDILDDINSLAFMTQKEPIMRDCVVKTADVEDFIRYAKSIDRI